MKPRCSVLFALALICALILPVAVSADTSAPPASAYAGAQTGQLAPPQALSGEESKHFGRALDAPAAVSPDLMLGQPGLSFRYTQTFGEAERAYFDDVAHLNYPYGVTADGNNVWIADARGLRAVKYAGDGTFISQIGKSGFRYSTGQSLESVVDVGVDGSGNVWLVDEDVNHVLKFDAAGKYLGKLGRSYEWGQGNDSLHGPHGIAFDGAGNIYVSDSYNHRIQVFKSDSSYLATIGQTDVYGSDNAHFCNPQHIAISGATLWVADGCNHRIQIFNIANPAAAVYQATVGVSGQPGSDNAHLNLPYGVTVSANRIFVADQENHRVQVYDRATRAYQATISEGWGHDNAHMRHPTDVAVDTAGNLYVADWLNARVQQFNSSLAYVRTYGTTEVPYLTDNLHYNKPSGLAVAPDGSIYITEDRGQRLLKLDASGAAQWAVGAPGIVPDTDSNDRLNAPRDVALAPSGLVYVADRDNHRVQIFNPDGSYYGTLGTGYGTGNYQFKNPSGLHIDQSGTIYVADYFNDRVQIYNSNRVYVATMGVTGVAGSDNAHFNNPTDVVVDSRGIIYVSENGNYRVQVFDANRNYLRTIGVTGVGGDDFEHLNGPNHLAVDARDNLYVTSAWNHALHVYDANGGYLTSIGNSRGKLSGQLADPYGVALDAAGNLYVADYSNHRIQKYAPGVPGWKQVNINGFGDPGGRIDSMAPFGGNLYAGGGKTIRRMDSAGAWTTVMSDGFGSPSNVGIDHMIEFKGQLYAGTWTWVCDDANCNTGHPTGGQIWRTGNGTQWNRVVDAGFGDPINAEVFRFVVFKDQLYAATWASSNTHGAEIWRSSTGNPGEWTRVASQGFGDPTHTGVLAFAIHNDALYAGTFNGAGKGGEVWRSANGSDWQKVGLAGFGDSGNRADTGALASFGGNLYAGTYNSTSGGQVWRCAACDGSDWTRVVGDGFGSIANRRVAALMPFKGSLLALTGNYTGNGMEVRQTTDGQTWTPTAPPGFGDSNNRDPYWGNSVAVANNRLYVGTSNYANGAEIWATSLTADFTVTPSRGKPPLTVQFTNISAGEYTTSLWDFGDGQTSMETNPSHTYGTAGAYTVKLTVGDGTDSDTVIRQAAVRVGHTVYLPMVTRNWDPLLYDNFDDPQWDGAWNPAKWQISQNTATRFRQQDGALVVTEPPSANPTGGALYVINPQYRSWQKAQRIEARFKASSDRTGGWSPFGIAAVVENTNGHTWYASCRLAASINMSRASFGCSIFTEQGGNYPTEYATDGFSVDYNTWCAARIETDPSTGAVRFYLDNTLIGSHTPVDAPALLTSNRVEIMITNNWGVEANSAATRYIDDVRITPAK